jgi:hypothetical protein
MQVIIIDKGTYLYYMTYLLHINYLTAELLDVKKLLLQVLSSDPPSSSAFENSVLPIKSRDEFLKLEANLSEKQSFDQLVRYVLVKFSNTNMQ